MSSSSTITTVTVAYSSVPSMPANAFAWSAPIPAGPVTWVTSPGCAPAEAVARRLSTAGPRLFHPVVPTCTGTTVCSACPSAEATGPTTGATTCGAPANASASRTALAWSSTVMPPARW